MEMLETITSNELCFNENYFNMFLKHELAETRETTLKGYMVGLKNFLLWTKANNIVTPTEEDIENYKLYLKLNDNIATSTKSRYLRVVKQFFNYLNKRKLYEDVTINTKNFKIEDTTTKRALTKEEIRKVLEGIERSTEEGKRNYLMILLAVTGGLRTIELNRINLEDIETIDGQTIIHIQGKGKDTKTDYIKVIPSVEDALKDYLNVRKDKNIHSALFTSTSNRALGQRIPNASISRIIKTILKESGFNSVNITAHSLRHTSNTLLFNSGATLYDVQQHARHKDPKTTERYIHAEQRKNKEYEQDIYNVIYNDKKTNKALLMDELKNITEEDAKDLLEYIRTLKAS